MGMKPEFERAISHISKATFYQPSVSIDFITEARGSEESDKGSVVMQ